MQFPIVLGLHRSFFLGAWLIASTLLSAALGLLYLEWQMAFRLIWCLVIATGAAIAWKELAPRFSSIRLDRSGRVFVLADRDHAFKEAWIDPARFVHPWLCICRLRTETRERQYLIIAMDSTSLDDFRKLRVFLRWQASKSSDSVLGDA